MLILDATNKSITCAIDAAPATTNPDYIVSYADITTTTFTPGAADGALNGTTPVTIVGSPASSTQRQVKYISISNRDTINHTITVNYVDGASTRQMLSWFLSVGDTLIYSEKGWFITNSVGAEKTSSVLVRPSSYLNSVCDAANITTAVTFTSGTSFAVYLGTAAFVSSSVTVRFNVTTAMATITYGELGIFTGAINLGGNPTLTRNGYADISAIANSTGVKGVTVSLSTPLNIGDEVWAVFGDSATTTLQIRAGLADELQSGTFATLAGQPSTVTSPTAWTVAANNVAVPWVKAIIN